MSRRTRSDDIFFQLEEDVFRRTNMLDLTRVQQLPTTKYVIERYISIKDELPAHETNKENCALSKLANELRYIWIHMNIPCLSYSRVRKKIKDLSSSVMYLKKVHEGKRKDKWRNDVKALSQKLTNGFDIRSFSEDMKKEMETLYGVKISEDEEAFYRDNCLLVDDEDNQLEKCKRLCWSGEVDSNWWRQMLKRKEKPEKDKQFRQLAQVRLEREKTATLSVSSEAIDELVPESEKSQESSDEEFIPSSSNKSKAQNNISTRSVVNSEKKMDEKFDERSDDDGFIFPQIPVRTGYRTINLDIMETLVVMESAYKVEERKCTQLLTFIANKIFGQKWSADTKEEDEDEEEDDQLENEEDEVEEPVKKKRRKVGDLEYVLPSRLAISKWVQQFSLLSLKDAATQITEARKCNKVVNYGVDDTVKAAGNKPFNMKAAHITIVSEENSQESFSTGFNINVSHSGVEAARTVKYDIAKLAVLTGNSFESMIEMIDFFMTDREADNETMLDELKINENKRLKCNAHVVLAVDAALEKTFKDTEALIGTSNLITAGAAHVFSSSANSSWYLGLITLAKLVSPSHMKESISLYKDYTDFLKENVISHNEHEEMSSKLLKNGFKGFVSNRFGRVGELSNATVTRNC